MTEASDLTTLIERLEAAEVGSRELDEKIHNLLCASKERTCIKGLSDADGGLWMYDFPGHNPSSALRVTTSLDAALALAERLFPNAEIYIGRHEGQWDADCEPVGCDRSARFVDHKGATPALALCIAILRAKEASQ